MGILSTKNKKENKTNKQAKKKTWKQNQTGLVSSRVFVYDNIVQELLPYPSPRMPKNHIALKFTYVNAIYLIVTFIPKKCFGYGAVISTLDLISSENNVVKWRLSKEKEGLVHNLLNNETSCLSKIFLPLRVIIFQTLSFFS